MDLNKFGGRRFLLCLGCGVATTVLTWFGKIDAGTYSVVILGTVGVYVSGNVYQKREEIRATQGTP